ncbi:unnamed protein product [Parajaminaea phylloscopi]
MPASGSRRVSSTHVCPPPYPHRRPCHSAQQTFLPDVTHCYLYRVSNMSSSVPSSANAASGTTTKGTIKADDGLDLHFTRYHPDAGSQSGAPSGTPQLSVVFIHGFAEHVGRYSDTFPAFAAKGIELISFDQRGFGNTADAAPGGFAKNYTTTTWAQQFKDVQAVVKAQREWLNERYGGDAGAQVPIFLLGHSMGGGIAMAVFTRDATTPEHKELAYLRENVKGVVASSPWLTLTNPPPGLLVFLGPRLARWFPSLKYPAGLKAEALTRDKEEQAKWEADPWIQNWVKLVSAVGPLLGGEDIVKSKWKNWKPDVPILIAHGEDDAVTSHKASKTVVEQLKTLSGPNGNVDAQYVGFPEGRHEMMFETGDVRGNVSILGYPSAVGASRCADRSFRMLLLNRIENEWTTQFVNTVIDWLLAKAGSQVQPGQAEPVRSNL